MRIDDFNQMMLRNMRGLVIKSYKVYTNQVLTLKAAGEKDDEYWQVYQAEFDRLNEIKRRWMDQLQIDLCSTSNLSDKGIEK